MLLKLQIYGNTITCKQHEGRSHFPTQFEWQATGKLYWRAGWIEKPFNRSQTKFKFECLYAICILCCYFLRFIIDTVGACTIYSFHTKALHHQSLRRNETAIQRTRPMVAIEIFIPLTISWAIACDFTSEVWLKTEYSHLLAR